MQYWSPPIHSSGSGVEVGEGGGNNIASQVYKNECIAQEEIAHRGIKLDNAVLQLLIQLND